MFTGLIEATGRLVFVRRDAEGMRLGVDVRPLVGDLRVGDSVSLSGCCGTVARLAGGQAEFDLTRETLARTWFARAEAGRVVNLERALTPATRMGGHFVQGHVDDLGASVGLERRRDGADLVVRVPPGVLRYAVIKGSIAIDGVSLTVAGIDADRIRVALVPHTIATTTLGDLRPGQPVHLEADVLAKYVEALAPPAR